VPSHFNVSTNGIVSSGGILSCGDESTTLINEYLGKDQSVNNFWKYEMVDNYAKVGPWRKIRCWPSLRAHGGEIVGARQLMSKYEMQILPKFVEHSPSPDPTQGIEPNYA
jgi:hypothetical protein